MRHSAKTGKLVFGVSRLEKRIVHVSEVERGAQCLCVCPACRDDLVAKKGKVRVHHFSHAVEKECDSACETALHQFAKRVFAERRTLALPTVSTSGLTGSGKTICIDRSGPPVETFDSVLLEDQRAGFRADATGRQNAVETFVEFFVTHRVSDEKLTLMKAVGARSVEIDLRGMNTTVKLSEIADEILFKAPREWVCHPLFSEIESDLRSRIAQADEDERVAIETRKLEEAKRKADAEAERVSMFRLAKENELREIVGLVSYARNMEKPLPIDTGAVLNIEDAGLERFAGVAIRGDWIFYCHRKYWQAEFIEEFVLVPKRQELTRKTFTLRDVTRWAAGHSLFPPKLFPLYKDEECELLRNFPDFESPMDVLQLYMGFLQRSSGIILDLGFFAYPGGVDHEAVWCVSKSFLEAPWPVIPE